jgi:hypothetical protein
MANNRMFLVHVPSGLGVHLGKRMARGWYLKDDSTGLGPQLQRFYDMLAEQTGYAGEPSQDAFALAMEDADGAVEMPPWQYGEMEGEFRRFNFLAPPMPGDERD